MAPKAYDLSRRLAACASTTFIVDQIVEPLAKTIDAEFALGGRCSQGKDGGGKGE